MEVLQQMLPQQDAAAAEAESGKTSKAKTGFKRALLLVIILMIFTIIHTILQRLSDGNFNALVNQMVNKMNSIGILKNITKN